MSGTRRQRRPGAQSVAGSVVLLMVVAFVGICEGVDQTPGIS
jgi:hypothetical protein